MKNKQQLENEIDELTEESYEVWESIMTVVNRELPENTVNAIAIMRRYMNGAEEEATMGIMEISKNVDKFKQYFTSEEIQGFITYAESYDTYEYVEGWTQAIKQLETTYQTSFNYDEDTTFFM